MKRDKKKICEIISTMLDNPNKEGIFPTTNAYNNLEEYIEQERLQTLGWMYAYVCSNSEDIKK